VLARCRDYACDFLIRCPAGCSSEVFLLSILLPSHRAAESLYLDFSGETLPAKLLCRSTRMVCYARTLSLRGTPKTRTADSVCGDIIVLERGGYALSPTGRAWIEFTTRVHLVYFLRAIP
jgi:hypothetical protein